MKTSKPPCALPVGMSVAGAGRLVLLPYWTCTMRPFVPPGGVRGAGAGLLPVVLLPYWTTPTSPFAQQGGCTELELDG